MTDLRSLIGPRRISKFVQKLVRPHVVRPNLDSEYAEMARDTKREEEAIDWAESTFTLTPAILGIGA